MDKHSDHNVVHAIYCIIHTAGLTANNSTNLYDNGQMRVFNYCTNYRTMDILGTSRSDCILRLCLGFSFQTAHQPRFFWLLKVLNSTECRQVVYCMLPMQETWWCAEDARAATQKRLCKCSCGWNGWGLVSTETTNFVYLHLSPRSAKFCVVASPYMRNLYTTAQEYEYGFQNMQIMLYMQDMVSYLFEKLQICAQFCHRAPTYPQ